MLVFSRCLFARSLFWLVPCCRQNIFHIVASASSRNAARKGKEKDAVNYAQGMRRSNITACDDCPVILTEFVGVFRFIWVCLFALV